MSDLIDRQAAIDALCDDCPRVQSVCPHYPCREYLKIEELPSAQTEQTDCEYCHEDSDGYARSIEKNSHVWLIRRGKVVKLRVGLKGEYRECDILFCPMCGRRLTDGRFN